MNRRRIVRAREALALKLAPWLTKPEPKSSFTVTYMSPNWTGYVAPPSANGVYTNVVGGVWRYPAAINATWPWQ